MSDPMKKNRPIFIQFPYRNHAIFVTSKKRDFCANLIKENRHSKVYVKLYFIHIIFIKLNSGQK